MKRKLPTSKPKVAERKVAGRTRRPTRGSDRLKPALSAKPARTPVGTPRTTPRYEQLKREILERIASGEWGGGLRLPSEFELVKQYGMSRMTIHRALRELSVEGVLSRRKGIGTFVLPPAPRSELLAIPDIAEDITRRGHSHRCRILVREEMRADLNLATSFLSTVGMRLFHSVMVHSEGSTPIQLEERYVNPAFAPKYLETDFERVTPARYLRELAAPTEIENIIFAGFPNETQRKSLEMRSDEPCLLVMRRTWFNELVATRSLFVYPAGRYSLGSRYQVNAAGMPTRFV